MKFISLSTKLMVATILFILLPVAVVGISAYIEIEGVLMDRISRATSERLNQININIERELKAILNASSSVALDDNIKHVLTAPPANDKETLQNTNLIDKKVLEISTAIMNDPLLITIIDSEYNYYTNWQQSPAIKSRIEQSEFYRKALEQQGYVSWSMNHPNYVNPDSEPLITLSMTIRDSTFHNNIGMLIISEPTSKYLRILRNSDVGDMWFIMDRDGKVMTEDRAAIADVLPSLEPKLTFRNDRFTQTLKKEQMSVYSNYIPLTEWLIVQVVPDSFIFNQIAYIRNNATVTLIISLTLFIGLVIVVTSMFTRSLKKLHATISRVEAGNLDVSFEIRSRDEVGLLGKSFSKMLKRLRYHIENEIILERSKEKLKLEALQAQINPHFLHNTIHTIKMMSIMAGTKNITEILLSLGRLLNMSIHRGQELISVEEELANVRSFLTIQKFRFGDTIQTIEDIDPEAMQAVVPKLSLQPLVENVYQHGLFLQGGKMIISIRKNEERLVIEVIDNGEMLSESGLHDMNRMLHHPDSQKLSGIGLNNVHRRIQMMFGHAYGLTITRDQERAVTLVSMTLPYRRYRDGLENIDY